MEILAGVAFGVLFSLWVIVPRWLLRRSKR